MARLVESDSSSPGRACSLELQEGRRRALLVDRRTFDGSECANPPVVPLGLTAPARRRLGVRVRSSRSYAGPGAARRRGRSRRRSGDRRRPGPSGRATVSFAAAGTVRLQATKTGLVRSETRDVVVSAPGRDVAHRRSAGSVAAADKAAPTAALIGLRDKQVLSAGPRELRGRFADASGMKTVKLRLTKRLGNSAGTSLGAWSASAARDAARGASFVIGDRAEWSYLLPDAARRGPLRARRDRDRRRRQPHAAGARDDPGGVHRPMKWLAVLLAAALFAGCGFGPAEVQSGGSSPDRLAGLRRGPGWCRPATRARARARR